MEYKAYKNALSRLGFAPHGKSHDMWCFALYEPTGCYDVVIYLDEDCTPFEYRLDFSCGKVEDKDITLTTFDELLNEIRATKRANR